jgi:hypothetical protein
VTLDAETIRALMRDHFREQVGFCDVYGSPFTARLIERMAADYDDGGPVAKLLSGWSSHPRADAVAIRLAGALHAAALRGMDPALAAEYPAEREDWEIESLWARAHGFLARELGWVREFIKSAPQTNEVRRSIALLLGFLHFARGHDLPLDVLEVGASAGLNLHWDRFRYETSCWTWGAPGGVVIDTEWHGAPPPLDVRPRVRSRMACDLNPLDVRDPAQRLQLRSYVWADQLARLSRFDAAVDVAIASNARVERADAAEWLEQRLAARAPEGAAIVYHSVFLQYPPPPSRKAIVNAIVAAGERATERAPLAWLRLEPEVILGGPRDSVRFLVDMITWPGATRRTLAVTDGHARRVDVLDAGG